VDEKGRLVGIVSKGDLMHRAKIGTERRHSWWLRVLTGDDALAAEYSKVRARTVADIMTRVSFASDGMYLDRIEQALNPLAGIVRFRARAMRLIPPPFRIEMPSAASAPMQGSNHGAQEAIAGAYHADRLDRQRLGAQDLILGHEQRPLFAQSQCDDLDRYRRGCVRCF
jgi:hypothetical protein